MLGWAVQNMLFAGTIHSVTTIRKANALGIFLTLLLLCSCATSRDSSPMTRVTELPAELTMNVDTGRGGWLIVMIRLENGEELPFGVDTGSSDTIIDKSLEQTLGKRLGEITLRHWSGDLKAGIYAAPKLFAEGTPLMTGDAIASFDLKEHSSNLGRPMIGILGMDCLGHYCIQLDFETRKMRFLDSAHSNTKEWGKAFPLSAVGPDDARPTIRGNLIGVIATRSQIDTGDSSDGWLTPKFFQQWTNQLKPATMGEAPSQDGVLGGETYAQLSLRQADVVCDGIGLHFLARHLVTLDFPNRTMYLKRASIGPLADEGVGAIRSYLMQLKSQGQLPGWLKSDHGAQTRVMIDPPSGSEIVDLQKIGDSSIYHYKVAQTSKGGSWLLQKAWRTDKSGHTIEEFPIP
jgi:hypothetical protein